MPQLLLLSGIRAAQCIMSCGRRGNSLDQVSFGLPDGHVYSEEEQCFGGPAQSSRPDSSYRMFPSSKSVRGNLLGVRSSPSRPLCHPHQCQASSSSGPRECGSRTSSNSLGTICQPMPSLCLPCLGRCCQEFCFRPGSCWF